MKFTAVTVLAIAAGAFALPNEGNWWTTSSSSSWKTTSTSSKPTTTSKPTSSSSAPTKTTVTTTATPSGTNNGQQFVNKCLNFGISVADCTELLNIALLNGATVVVGGAAPTPSAGAVNNGQEFLNECANLGISILDCAELLNIAALNGLTIDIDVADILSLLSVIGIPTPILSGLLPSGTGLITLPTGLNL